MGAGFTSGFVVSFIRQLLDAAFSVKQIVLCKKSSFLSSTAKLFVCVGPGQWFHSVCHLLGEPMWKITREITHQHLI